MTHSESVWGPSQRKDVLKGKLRTEVFWSKLPFSKEREVLFSKTSESMQRKTDKPKPLWT